MALPSFTLPFGSSVLTGLIGDNADVIFWEDFLCSSVLTQNNVGWDININTAAVDTSDNGTAIVQGTSENNGVATLTSATLGGGAAVVGDHVQIHPGFTVAYDAKGGVYMEVKVKQSAITEQLYIGFQATSNGTSGNGAVDTNPYDGGTPPTDFIWFVIDAADIKCRLSRFDLVTSTADPSTPTPGALLGTLTDTGLDVTAGTYVTLAIHVAPTAATGELGAHFYVDGSLKTVLTDSLPNLGVRLTPVLIAQQKTTSAVTVADFDYVLVGAKRIS
jgi:hypothetical protein